MYSLHIIHENADLYQTGLPGHCRMSFQLLVPGIGLFFTDVDGSSSGFGALFVLQKMVWPRDARSKMLLIFVC